MPCRARAEAGLVPHQRRVLHVRRALGGSLGWKKRTGYWYEQITGDHNNPEILGDFKGRAIALGPEASYQFMKNPKRPVTIDLRRTGRSLEARHARSDFTTSVGESGHERDEVYGRIGRRPGPDACGCFHLNAFARDPDELTGARAVSATTSFR